ncbi:MAG: GTPase Era [Candidatus Gracilibacteria bacterium]|nr:GTPase Era [Candidatus Gracilibacteria bacterium]
MKELNLQDILENTSDLTKEKKVGYVAIIGRPNAGKSTFVNSLIGEKISITTNVPQTTRKRVLAIYNDDETQIIFFDTPGIHKSDKKFNEQINNVAISSFKDAEVVLYFIDSSREGGEEEKHIRQILEMVNKPIIKVYTKTDLEAKISIPTNENIVKISSISKDGFKELLEKVKSHLKTGPMFFPEDYYTKQDIYFRISEIIREKTFLHTKEEIPHSIYVGVEEIQDTEDLLKMVAYIYTETDSQKYIVIGKSGSLIQTIGKEARIELEQIFGKKVFLALRVKTKKNWRKDDKLIKEILN